MRSLKKLNVPNAIPFLIGATILTGSIATAALLHLERAPQQSAGDTELRQTAGLHPNENLLFNGWGITPAGQSVTISDMPLKMVMAPDGKTLAAVSGGFRNTGLTLVDIATRKVNQFVPLTAWNGLAFSPDGKHLWVTGGSHQEIHAFDFADGKVSNPRTVAPSADDGTFLLSGIAVQPATGKLYVCNEANNEVWVVNPDTLHREAVIPVGEHPYTCVFGGDRRHLYVSDWGGRSVTVVDSNTNQRVRDINVGRRPNDMALAPDGRLFVACSGDNTVHVVQTRSVEAPQAEAGPTRRPPEGVREILSTSLYPGSPEGSTPDGVAIAPDGKTLFVANADNNDVMVADISERDNTAVRGFVPVGWYPTAVAVSPDSGTLLVGNGKGLRSAPNIPAGRGRARRGKSVSFTYIPTLFEGSVSFITRPTDAQMADFTRQVKLNSPYTPETLQHAALASAGVIPDTPGKPCPIRYVLYIIKENRTYDQVFGDFKNAAGRPVGNGDPEVVMYGENVTPNHHQLARDYVLLDNLYCNGEVSVDGHSWCDAAMATDYNERSWIMSYSGHGKIPGNDELGQPTAGYLWDACRRAGLSFKCYGEGAGDVPNIARGTWPGGRDMKRVDGWIKDLQTAEGTGDLPRFMIMSLGEDHTSGAKPGAPTPDASVGSNDVALGRIVEAASHSKFWPEMAIFVIEDDAQNGPDHVDAHRTAGLVISPYVKRGFVDSTFYTTTSMVRTIELILGLPPLTQYDAAATPMFNSFTSTPQMIAYNPLQPRVNLMAMNPRKGPGAQASMKMDFDEYDRAPADELNQILWRLAKGPGVAYPAHRHGAILR